ncbi:sigma-70 family RNA polymerase sigma factor [Inhella crocodyli]|nr:sigma-70 family RNA polymerase sigma factor [Inhella crocodyli]
MNPISSDSHNELVLVLDRVAAGDADALRQLYDAAAPRLYGLALQVLQHRDLAQDALQEAFLQVWRNAGDYRASLSPPMAWLGMIVRSRALDLRRRRQSARADAVSLDDDGDGEQEPLAARLVDPEAGPDERLQASQLSRTLHHCLSKLEAKQRDAVALAYLRDLSHSELAAQLSVPLGTVKSWVRRGLLQLRGCLSAFAGGLA